MLNYMRNLVLATVVVNAGMGSGILTASKKMGINGGTIVVGRGTMNIGILKHLGIDKEKKEIVYMICNRGLEDRLHEELTRQFRMDKPNHGIVCTISVSRAVGTRIVGDVDKGGSEMNYEIIYVVVERGYADEVVDIASKAGSTGATIINARGSGLHEINTFFAMNIEPEKEVVMMITEKSSSEGIIGAIESELNISEPGNGILYVVDVNRVSGLYK